MDMDGFWKPTKKGLGMKVVIEYLEKYYDKKSNQQEKLVI